MTLYDDINNTWIVGTLTEPARIGSHFLGGVAFGGPGAIAKGSKQAYDYLESPSDYKFTMDRYQLAGYLGVPASRLIDKWLIKQGGVSLAEARTGRAVLGAMKFFKHAPQLKLIAQTVKPHPATYGHLAYMGAGYFMTKATTGAIESVVVGTQNPITNTYSPKPFWMPLPLFLYFF